MRRIGPAVTDNRAPDSAPTSPRQDIDTELNDVRAELAALRREMAARDWRDAETARNHAQLLSALQHRVRNTAALVRTVFERTIDTAESLEEAERHFSGRLGVLVRYQLPRGLEMHRGIDFDQLVRDELQQFDFGFAPGITIAGPAVSLPLEQAQPIGLAIHELVTNALKFGALLEDAGKLEIRWAVSGQRVELTWSESEVAGLVKGPLHRGFGREFIEDGLPYQIGADTSFVMGSTGILCRIAWSVGTRTGAGRR